MGRETAMRLLKGKHAFIVATHADRAHIQNHIIYNYNSLDCTRKFRNFFLSSGKKGDAGILYCQTDGGKCPGPGQENCPSGDRTIKKRRKREDPDDQNPWNR